MQVFDDWKFLHVLGAIFFRFRLFNRILLLFVSGLGESVSSKSPKNGKQKMESDGGKKAR
jgi:hypothetical protein